MTKRPTTRKPIPKDDNVPDFYIKIKPKDRDRTGWSTVGVGWQGDNGIKIQLQRGIHLDWKDFHGDYMDNFILMLVPNN
jgi:hypothetical protein